MKNFLLIYKSPIEAQAQWASASSEQKMEGMKPWMAWREKMGENLVDFGAPTGHSSHATEKHSWQDNPSIVGGYSIIKAEDLSAAKDMINDHPHLAMDQTSIELHECQSM